VQKQNLLLQKELLDVKIAKLESLENIVNSEDLQNMEKVEDPDFAIIRN